MGSIMVEGEISIPQVEVPTDTPMTETTPEVSESANEIKAADEAEAKKEDGTGKLNQETSLSTITINATERQKRKEGRQLGR